VEPARQLSVTDARVAAPVRRLDRGARSGYLALVVMLSAGIHAALIPEHLDEMPRLGDAFIAAAVIGCLLASALVTWPDSRRIQVLAGLFCLGQIAAWALFVTTAVPGFDGTPEGVEAIAVVCKGVEALAVALAFPSIWRVRGSVGRHREAAGGQGAPAAPGLDKDHEAFALGLHARGQRDVAAVVVER
jgi:hypothetical protein